MRILLPTGRITAGMVRDAAVGIEAEVHITGELASFLTPGQLIPLIKHGSYDMVIVSGMCTASFAAVEKETGIPVYKGPRHAADLKMVLNRIPDIELSREIPADEFLAAERKKEALDALEMRELKTEPAFTIRGVKIGGGSRIKVLAEIMDAHLQPDIRSEVIRFFSDGADIVDLGFGFDATEQDVERVFSMVKDLPGPLAIDTQDPALIKAGLFRADIVLSLHEGNLEQAGPAVAECGACAVVIPGACTLEENLYAAEKLGISSLIADPILEPAGSGLIKSLAGFREYPVPVFFGAGNVIELIDADSIGISALLAAMATEAGASVIFCSEHSDKTKGCVAEMRQATMMMSLMDGRPYPKDLGLDLLCIKEKRKRREPPLEYHSIRDAEHMPREITYDPCGNYRIGIEKGLIVAVKNGKAIRGERWQDIFYTILKEEEISLMDHAAYLGQELAKAELALRFGRSFEQDGPF